MIIRTNTVFFFLSLFISNGWHLKQATRQILRILVHLFGNNFSYSFIACDQLFTQRPHRLQHKIYHNYHVILADVSQI